MQEGRTPADLYHRFGAQVALPSDPCANATMTIGVRYSTSNKNTTITGPSKFVGGIPREPR